jgi:hypothetical protein
MGIKSALLGYAVNDASRRNSYIFRATVILSLLAMIVAAYSFRLLDKAAWHWAQRSCETYSTNHSRELVYEECARGSTLLPVSNSSGILTRNENGMSWRRKPPFCLNKLATWMGSGTNHYNQLVVLFLGTMRANDDRDRIVLITWYSHGYYRESFRSLIGWEVIQPGELFGVPRPTCSGANGILGASNDVVASKGAFRLRMGTIDPSNSAHCIIPYEVNGEVGAIDGWLKDDHLSFSITGPGARTPTPN